MLQILGVGFAAPANQISNQLISELNPNLMQVHFEQDIGISSRSTVLDLKYLVSSKNSDLLQSFANIVETDLELAARAVHSAVAQAGIRLEDIGLVIGETSTPFQTIPSQAQRIAGALGMKVKAYDLLAGAASPAFHLATLAAWREERLPDYVLLVYSNLPTVFIDYAAVTPSLARFSDAAAAIVISTKRKGALSLLSVSSKSDTSIAAETIDIFGPLHISNVTEKVIESKLELIAQEALKSCPRAAKRNYFIPSQLPLINKKRFADILGFAEDEVLISPYGDSFSSTPFGPFCDRFECFSSGDRVYLALCGIGLQFGHIVLEVN